MEKYDQLHGSEYHFPSILTLIMLTSQEPYAVLTHGKLASVLT